MKDYDYVTTFFPSSSDRDYKEMWKFLEENNIDFWYESKEFGDYYLEWYETGHERDSSGDHLTVWKKPPD